MSPRLQAFIIQRPTRGVWTVWIEGSREGAIDEAIVPSENVKGILLG